WDGEAIVIAADDPGLTRRILDVNRDQRACFDAARRVAGWFARAGATEITVAGALACVTDSAHPLMQSLLRRRGKRPVARGGRGGAGGGGLAGGHPRARAPGRAAGHPDRRARRPEAARRN